MTESGRLLFVKSKQAGPLLAAIYTSSMILSVAKY